MKVLIERLWQIGWETAGSCQEEIDGRQMAYIQFYHHLLGADKFAGILENNRIPVCVYHHNPTKFEIFDRVGGVVGYITLPTKVVQFLTDAIAAATDAVMRYRGN